MKKILIISHSFNYDVSGSVRLQGLAKYITNFGWEPTILTIKSDKQNNFPFRILETEYSDIKDNWKIKLGLNPKKGVKNQLNIQSKKNEKGFIDILLGIWVDIFAYPDEKKNWYKPAIESGNRLLENESFDAILSSSYPFTSHLIANELKKRHNLPWIADLRDLWTQNPYLDHTYFRKIFERRLEIKTLKNADRLTTISKPLKNDLEKLHKGKKIHTICNGFDPETQNTLSLLNKKLKITYSGILYNGKRDPEKLFRALNELKSDEIIDINNFSIDFYGPIEDWLYHEIKKYNLENIVNLNGFVPREKVLKKQKESQILLLLTWDNLKEEGIIPAKIFEYLAAKRPILSIGPSTGLIKDIIQSTNSGVHLSKTNEIKDQIYNYYKDFKFNGEVKYTGINEEIKKYSQIRMAKKFVHLLDSTITKS